MRFKVLVTAPHDRIYRYIQAPTYLHAIKRGRAIQERFLEKLGNPSEWRYELYAKWYRSGSLDKVEERWSLVETYTHESNTRH